MSLGEPRRRRERPDKLQSFPSKVIFKVTRQPLIYSHILITALRRRGTRTLQNAEPERSSDLSGSAAVASLEVDGGEGETPGGGAWKRQDADFSIPLQNESVRAAISINGHTC